MLLIVCQVCNLLAVGNASKRGRETGIRDPTSRTRVKVRGDC